MDEDPRPDLIGKQAHVTGDEGRTAHDFPLNAVVEIRDYWGNHPDHGHSWTCYGTNTRGHRISYYVSQLDLEVIENEADLDAEFQELL